MWAFVLIRNNMESDCCKSHMKDDFNDDDLDDAKLDSRTFTCEKCGNSCGLNFVLVTDLPCYND